MGAPDLPSWVKHLDEAELQFIKRMVLASGSLKQLAGEYEVSYPTIRLRLNRVIERVRLLDSHPDDGPFEAKIRILVSNGSLELRTGKELLRLHRSTH